MTYCNAVSLCSIKLNRFNQHSFFYIFVLFDFIIMVKCEHDLNKSECKVCNKCPHGKLKHRCIDCGGSSICEHKQIRARCVVCGGSQICEHNRRKYDCIDCKGNSICEHDKIWHRSMWRKLVLYTR